MQHNVSHRSKGNMDSTESNDVRASGALMPQPKLLDSMSKESGFEDDLLSTVSGTTTASQYIGKPTELKYRACPSKIHFKCGKKLSKVDISCTKINPRKILFSAYSKEELKSLNNEIFKVRSTVVSYSKRDENVVTITSQDTLDESQFNEWREKMTECINQYLEKKVHEENLQIKQENFELAKRKLHIMAETDKQYLFKVMVVFEDDANLVHVVGHSDVVHAFDRDVVAEMEKSETVTWKATLNNVESDLAHYGLLRAKLRKGFPLVDVAEEMNRDQNEITGFECDLQEAKEFVSTFFNITSQLTTTLSAPKMELIRRKREVKRHIREKLKTEDRTKDWTWHMVDNSIILTGPMDTILDGRLISDLLYERKFELSEFESEVVFTSEKWEKKLSELNANYNAHMILQFDQDCLILLCTCYFKDHIEKKIESMLIQTKTLKVSSAFGEFLQLRGKSILESTDYDMESDFLEFSWKTKTSEIEVEGTTDGVERLIETFAVMQQGFKKQKFAVTRKDTFSRLKSSDGLTLIEKVGSQMNSLLKIESAPVISLVREKIEEQKTSVIINSVSADLKLNVGQPKIATAIYEKGGDEFQKHILAKWPNGIKYGDMVIAEKKGNLACDWVFNCCLRAHTDDETTKKELKEMLFKCLEETKNKDRNCKSIAIPALGTGVNSYPAKIAAKTTFDVIFEFCSQNERFSLEEIKIVLFPEASKAVIQHFHDEFASRSVETGELLQIASGNIAPGYLWIYSESQDSLNSARTLIQDSLSKT